MNYHQPFSELYRRYSKQIFLFCNHHSRNSDDAQNIYQESWLSLFEKIKSGEQINSVPAFMVTICRRRIIDSLRNNSSKPDTVDVNDFDNIRTVVPDESFEINSILNRAIDSLELVYKEAFIMNKINGLNINEIAEITGETYDCIKKRVYRASEKVKTAVKNYINGVE
ncbi:MAG: sigma-70 family RNA polymerase sigma factor [Candidatus Kapabacteria bacterium]|nr:sigma-70 family RNA polymerase sigma factor [Candidatus Kapabacteria bacterium]